MIVLHASLSFLKWAGENASWKSLKAKWSVEIITKAKCALLFNVVLLPDSACPANFETSCLSMTPAVQRL